jgi:hypothetical protein
MTDGVNSDDEDLMMDRELRVEVSILEATKSSGGEILFHLRNKFGVLDLTAKNCKHILQPLTDKPKILAKHLIPLIIEAVALQTTQELEILTNDGQHKETLEQTTGVHSV